MTISVLMTSCQKEDSILNEESVLEVYSPEPDRERSTNSDLRACTTIPSSSHWSSYRNCTSRYVYAFSTNGSTKRYELYQLGVGKIAEVVTSNYYAVFGNLQAGVNYKYKAIRLCGSSQSNQPFSAGIGQGGCN